MARKLTRKAAKAAQERDTQKGHNAKVRAGIIRSVCRELNAIRRKIDALNAEQRELLNTKVKGDLDMPIADFRMAFRLYQLEGEKRDVLLDNLRETFEALGQGGQLDFIDAMRDAQKADAGDGATA
jgi:hypothetical protein